MSPVERRFVLKEQIDDASVEEQDEAEGSESSSKHGSDSSFHTPRESPSPTPTQRIVADTVPATRSFTAVNARTVSSGAAGGVDPTMPRSMPDISALLGCDLGLSHDALLRLADTDFNIVPTSTPTKLAVQPEEEEQKLLKLNTERAATAAMRTPPRLFRPAPWGTKGRKRSHSDSSSTAAVRSRQQISAESPLGKEKDASAGNEVAPLKAGRMVEMEDTIVVANKRPDFIPKTAADIDWMLQQQVGEDDKNKRKRRRVGKKQGLGKGDSLPEVKGGRGRKRGGKE